MSLCANCGRQSDETARFCDNCGAESGGAAGAADHTVTSVADLSADVTPAGANAGVSHPGPAAEEPDPFASWFRPDAYTEAAGGHDDAGAQWQPTQTVSAAPPAAGYPPPTTPHPPYPPTMPPPYPPAAQPARGGRRGLFITVAVVVVLAAGGGAYALASMLGKHGSPQPQPGAAVGASTPGTSTGAASAPASGSPTPSPAMSLVSIAPGVAAGPADADVETLLSHYFDGINTHNYAEYASTLDPAELAKQPQSTFDSGYATTTDSGMTLTSLTDNGGGLTATVSFASRQSPGQSVDKSACNNWTLNFYLVAQGSSGYLIGPAPSGYQPTYSDCS